MATKRGRAKKKNPCWKGYTAMGDDGKIIMKKKGNKMVPACRPIKDGASMGGKRKAVKELDKKSNQKVKTDKKGNVKKLTITRGQGLNEEKRTYKGGHVDAKSKTSYVKSKSKDKDGTKRKNTTATRTIDGSLSYGSEGGKKGKTVVKRFNGKTIYKTNRKGVRTVDKKTKRRYR